MVIMWGKGCVELTYCGNILQYICESNHDITQCFKSIISQ